MADYSNPMAMHQNVNSIPNNPFMSSVEAGNFQSQAAPFLDQARQTGQSELMKKRMETGEFMGQEAQQQRSLGRQSEMANSRSNIRLKPIQDQNEIDKIEHELRARPYVTDQHIAQAKRVASQADQAPIREFLAEIGALSEKMDAVPAEQRPVIYRQTVERWKAMNPGRGLPPQYEMYSDDVRGEMDAIRYFTVNTPEQIGKERLEGMRQDGAIVRGTADNNTRRDVASITASATSNAAAIAAGSRSTSAETSDKARARLRRELSSTHRNDPERMEEYKLHVDEAWNKQVTNRASLQLLEIQAVTAQDPKLKEEAQKKYNDLQNKFYADNGIYRNSPPPGTTRQFQGKTYRFDGGFGIDPNKKENWKPVPGNSGVTPQPQAQPPVAPQPQPRPAPMPQQPMPQPQPQPRPQQMPPQQQPQQSPFTTRGEVPGMGRVSPQQAAQLIPIFQQQFMAAQKQGNTQEMVRIGRIIQSLKAAQ